MKREERDEADLAAGTEGEHTAVRAPVERRKETPQLNIDVLELTFGRFDRSGLRGQWPGSQRPLLSWFRDDVPRH